MFDRLVADGDRTTTGGVVMGYSGWYNEDGRMYARAENLATCGNCEGGWPIAGSAGDWLDDGLSMVKDLDRVLCPCGKNRVLAAGGSKAFYSDSESDPPVASPEKALVYGQQYTLTNSSGEPMANVPYRVRSGSVVIASGVTDSNGTTQRIATDVSKQLCLDVSGDH